MDDMGVLWGMGVEFRGWNPISSIGKGSDVEFRA